MNVLILGNLSSGKSSIAAELAKQGFAPEKNVFSIDNMRREHSDGTHAGEFYAWAHFLDVIQHPMPKGNGVYEFSGTGKNVWFVREAMKYSMEKHKQKWLVVYCLCDRAELLKRSEGRKYDIPIPFNFNEKTRASSIDYMSKALKENFGRKYWNTKEITVRTDQKTSKECVQEIIKEIK